MIKKRIIRGTDAYGSGHHLASRGSRVHKGVDLITQAGELVMSYCRGTVTKIGYPYNPDTQPDKGHFRYVEVTDCRGLKVRTFYLDPLVDVGDIVELDTVIGSSQDLTEVYPDGMTQHIHFEVKTGNAYLNPMKYLNLIGAIKSWVG